MKKLTQDVMFCMVCGAKLRTAYPGNDPENGPAEARCSKDNDHMSPNDYFEQRSMDEQLGITIGVLHDISNPLCPEEGGAPSKMRKRAELLGAYLQKLEQEWERAKWEAADAKMGDATP